MTSKRILKELKDLQKDPLTSCCSVFPSTRNKKTATMRLALLASIYVCVIFVFVVTGVSELVNEWESAGQMDATDPESFNNSVAGQQAILESFILYMSSLFKMISNFGEKLDFTGEGLRKNHSSLSVYQFCSNFSADFIVSLCYELVDVKN